MSGTWANARASILSRRRVLQASAAGGLALAGSLSGRMPPFAAGVSALAQTPVADPTRDEGEVSRVT